MPQNKLKKYGLFASKWFLLPALCYAVFFFIFNPQHLAHFSDSFYLDRGDGLQNVWNFWWVDFSLTQLGQTPYFTQYLHAPHGLTLVPQTMNIFNGLAGIPLMAAGLTLAQTVNTMVVFSFVMGGITMLWLVYYLTKSYKAAVLGGFMFTFSSYHFAHAIGHMQLISLEWVPLFLLLWIKMLQTKRYRYAAGAIFALLLVLLCDYYYFIYSVIAGCIIAAYWFAAKTPAISVLRNKGLAGLSFRQKLVKLGFNRKMALVLTAFAAGSLITCSPLLIRLLLINHSDKLLGVHDARVFSLDALSLFIPGGGWYWHSLTEWYTRNIEVYHAESSMYLGAALLVLLAVAWFGRKRLNIPRDVYAWWIILVAFFVMSLGPRLQAFGKTLDSIPLPYAWLEALIPSLKISGMPIRMSFMVQLAAVIIAAYVISRIGFKKWSGVALFAAIAAVAFLDVYPRPLPLPRTDPRPPYAQRLRDLPLATGSAVLDYAADTPQEALYNQTLHQKPLAFGYVTRTPQSVENKSLQIFADLEQGRYHNMCSVHKIRYIATDADTRDYVRSGYPTIFYDKATNIKIFDFRNGTDC